MTGWARKRFWKDAAPIAEGDGWEVRLDGRPLRTPARAVLRLPTRALAEAVAAEWAAQGDSVDPATMPVTRYANSALDKVAAQRDEVVTYLAAYGGSDLLCYRAEAPEALVLRQAAAWDPLLARAADELGAPLAVTAGIVHVAQPEDSLARLAAELAALDDIGLAAAHDLVALSGSLVIALAALRGWAAPEDLWTVSRIDEDWQAEQWGADAEAAEVAARKRAEFLLAHRVWTLSRPVA